jgi:hypothetical protein
MPKSKKNPAHHVRDFFIANKNQNIKADVSVFERFKPNTKNQLL